ncbi:MAG: DMT family transporter [Stappiaceae bacterium]
MNNANQYMLLPKASPGTGALVAVILSALLWGLYWVPIRVLEGYGLTGPWAGFSLSLAALVPALIVFCFAPHKKMQSSHILGAIAVGVAISLYGISLSYTDVIRAVLLFYLAPVWSTLIECLFMGRRWTWRSVLALLVSFAGIILICRGEVPLEGAGALGDWMALAAGLAWSVGAATIFAQKNPSLPSLVATSMGAAVLTSGLCVLLLSDFLSPISVISAQLIGVSFGFGAFYVLPVMLVTLWGALRFSPATMSFVLTAEIISGVGSGAIFLGEPFGWPESLGAILIGLGATVEVMRPIKRS